MNSSKTKKKTNTGKIPKPIKIKKENDHIIYPMEHYVDDRVELIRQIFSSLKPKTITNLAPDFLKKSTLGDIQEQCLNEILGISKKRLLSIINSTKCPTDTDSSSDDDVNSIQEHISLEEISSDSDLTEEKSSKTENKRKTKLKGETDNENNKQFSVLELLELQARARAIRSQLALEPVTKIEVDTDSDEEGATAKKSDQTSSQSNQKLPNGSTKPRDTTKTKKQTKTLVVLKPNGDTSAPTKRIKLKRNFRKQNRDNSDNETRPNETVSNKSEDTKPMKENRSPSPDVIPIIAVPETLCISDSDEELPSSKPADTLQTPLKSKPVQILSVESIAPPSKPENAAETPNNPQASPKKTIPDEAEEGEIVEDEASTKIAKEVETQKESEDNTELTTSKEETNIAQNNEEPKEVEITEEIKQLCEVDEADDAKPQSVNGSGSEDDTNDDVISLEGGDILNEMKKHLDEDEIEEIKEATISEEIINLDDSSEEELNNKKESMSWNERWLKSSKVSKVLAASRLGNRVRNKIKESKKAKKLEEAALIESEQTKPTELSFVSKHEDGSVEQYKEILETVPKKTD